MYMHRLYALLAPVIFAAIIYGSYVAYDHVSELVAEAEESWGWIEAKVLGTPAAPVVPANERATYTQPKVDHFVLRKKFTVNKLVSFQFQVPPHIASPRFQGRFRAYIRDAAAPVSQQGTVDYLLLTESQYDEFRHGAGGEAVDSADNSHAHQSSIILSPTFNEPKNYYIIFRNSSGPETRVVEADFTADFSN
jgi:hypothetical protein